MPSGVSVSLREAANDINAIKYHSKSSMMWISATKGTLTKMDQTYLVSRSANLNVIW